MPDQPDSPDPTGRKKPAEASHGQPEGAWPDDLVERSDAASGTGRPPAPHEHTSGNVPESDVGVPGLEADDHAEHEKGDPSSTDDKPQALVPAEIVLPGIPEPPEWADLALRDRQADLSPEQRAALDARVGHVARGDVATLIETWLQKRPRSERAYRSAVTVFASWLGATTGNDFDAVEGLEMLFACAENQATALLEQWAGEMLEAGLAPGTVRSRVSAIRSIARLARKVGLIDWEARPDLPVVHDYRDMAGPDPEAISTLIEIIREDESQRGIRDWALLTLLLLQALRRSEVVGLDVEHYDASHQRMWVLGKGRLQREAVELENLTAVAVERWLDVHDDPLPESPLFHSINAPSNAEHRLTDEGVYHIFQHAYREKVAERLGVPLDQIHLRPHGFRHAAITRLVESGAGYEDVRRFARHASLATTQRYIDRVNQSVRESARAIAKSLGLSFRVGERRPGAGPARPHRQRE